jgi:hypothetical protein
MFTSSNKTLIQMKDQYIDLCEARVDALEKELELLMDFVARDYERRDIERETVVDLFNKYKENVKKESN